MNQHAAGKIIAYLNAAFPRDALEPESVAVFGKDICLLADADLGLAAAQEVARTQTHFPVLKEFREVYHRLDEAKRLYERDTTPAIEGPRSTEVPEWVSVWAWAKWSRIPRNEQSLPQQTPYGDPDNTLSQDDYEALRAEWVAAGSPKRSQAELVDAMVGSL